MKLGLFLLEQNDFILADGSEVEEFEDLNATLCMMVQIQQIGDDSNNGSIYDSGFINEFNIQEDEYLDNNHNLEEKINKNENVVVKISNSIQSIHMLSPKPDSFYDSNLKNGLSYKNPYTLKKAISLNPKLYDASYLHNSKLRIDVCDTEEILEDATNKASTSKVTPIIENVSNLSSPPLKMPKPSKLQKYFQNLEAEIQISGHEYKKCNKRVLTEEEKKEMNKSDVQNVAKVNDGNKIGEEWQEVKRIVRVGAGTSKNVDGVQVMGDSKNKNRKDVGQGKSKSNEGVKQKMKDQNVLNNKINLACDLRMKIADNEKKIWSKDLRKYYDDKCTMKTKANMIEKVDTMIMEQFDKGLKNCMDDEVAEENHRCAKFMTEDIVSNEVESDSAQMQGDVFENWDWVSNSVDSRKGCRIVVGWDPAVSVVQLLSQNSQAMHSMVKGINDSEWFYVTFIYAETNVKDRKWLWNNLKEHNVIVNKCLWVLLGDFNVILHLNESTNGLIVKNFGLSEFKECIEELEMEDICSNEVFFTWIQKIRNPDEGVLKKLDRVMGNSHFIAKNFTSYAKFLPYATSDHSPAILVIPEVVVRRCRSFRFMNFLTDKKGFLDAVKDNWNILVKGYAMYVLVKRLKHLKNHMRSLNRENGNVFDKAKVLKDELTRVQECLDKDHLNASLREEEMVYAAAYKQAAIDEEKVLKQKKGLVCSRKVISIVLFFIRCIQEIYPIEDPDFLFIRKLDNEVSVEMIKPVSDDEIKFALFDIDEDKASGRDGYTSKFFKASWKVIGPDVCNAIKQFFSNGKLLGQSAFIPERQISDNIMLTQEFIRGYGWNEGSRRCAFKIDIQ
ncbi:RNA-directed DNA polymerase, eukaryota, reverse transcriptase zinc-binding domain protein [Tanacetum coccineum]